MLSATKVTRRLVVIGLIGITAIATVIAKMVSGEEKDRMSNPSGTIDLPRVDLKKIAELETGYGEQLAFSPNGHQWVTSSSGIFYLWDNLELQESVETLDVVTQRVQFSQNGRELLICPLIYDLNQRDWVDLPPIQDSLVEGLSASSGPEQFAVYGGSWSPDGQELVVYAVYRPSRRRAPTPSYGGPEKRLLLLQGRTRKLIQVLWEGSDWQEYKTLAMSNRYIAAAGVQIWVWDRKTRQKVAELKQHTAGVKDMRFSPDGTRLATVGADKMVYLWDVANWTPIASWQGHEDEITAVAFHPKLSLLATGGSDNQLHLWSLTGQLIKTEQLSEPVEGIAFSPAGDRLVIAANGSDTYLYVYDVVQ